MVLFCNAVEEETNNLLKPFLFTIEIYACFCLFQLVQASPEVKERRGEVKWRFCYVLFCCSPEEEEEEEGYRFCFLFFGVYFLLLLRVFSLLELNLFINGLLTSSQFF
jgi:hypothetical protein